MRNTKKQTTARRAEWAKAVKEGRVIRMAEGRFMSFPTLAARDLYLATLEKGQAEVVKERSGS